MVTVEMYIRKLLFEHDCVIIPEFGGLLTHHVGAHYDAINSAFLPARKRLAFNEVLKIDDGLLTYYVAAHEKLPREEAITVVRRYVDSLRQDLNAGGVVRLDSIGSFSMNPEGKLLFEPDYSQNYNSEWYGMQSLAAREITADESSTKERELNVLDSEMEFVVTTGELSSRRSNWFNWVAAAVFVGAVTLLSTLNSTSNSSSLLSTLNPFETVKDFTIDSYIPALNPPEAVVVKVPKIKSVPVEVVAYIPKSELLTEENKQKSSPSGSKELVEKKYVSAANSFESPKKVESTKDYYLIAGSFGSLKNAEILKKHLINKGFTESRVLDNPGGSLIKVSAGSYSTMENAMYHKRKVDSVTGAESWVYHHK
jgi:hypothetical protein